jgi:SRSO17 transposase
MTGKQLLGMTRDLERYLRGYDGFLGRKENRANFRRFARGQLGPVERKSLEPIADAEGVPPRVLQEFFSQSRWEERAVRDELQQRVAKEFGGEDGIFVVDETSDAKKGEMTAGVARQYCGATGKIDNCIVTVHVAYVRGAFQGLVDGELFLPESWNANPADPAIQEKRKRAGIPQGVGHVPKPQMALEMLARAQRNGVPARWVTGDESYGRNPRWRQAVAGMGLWYVVEVPRDLMGWVKRPKFHRPKPWRGQGRPATRRAPYTPPRTVTEWNAQAHGWLTPWVRFRVHDTHKGPEVWDARLARLWEHGKNASPEPLKLIAARNVRTGEEKFFVAHAPDEQPLAALLKVAFSRARIERCFQDAKTELGLDHAEVRKYRALHRHLILTAVNLFFLTRWQLRRRGKKKGTDAIPVGECAAGSAGA